MPDVVIIGAGPAGSIAAIILARAGIDVVLIEQHRFPRDKVCGECLSALGIDVLRRLRLSRQSTPQSSLARSCSNQTVALLKSRCHVRCGASQDLFWMNFCSTPRAPPVRKSYNQRAASRLIRPFACAISNRISCEQSKPITSSSPMEKCADCRYGSQSAFRKCRCRRGCDRIVQRPRPLRRDRANRKWNVEHRVQRATIASPRIARKSR